MSISEFMKEFNYYESPEDRGRYCKVLSASDGVETYIIVAFDFIQELYRDYLKGGDLERVVWEKNEKEN